ncbi:MAG: helix-turn-helix transcriptional regulator, partial [Paramuribaculum sp.]|nr:helix-turn-helix transcriptional regulator [Paramuribaculum sp.]
LDVNLLAAEMCMSRSKLYSKLKALTGKSIVEFITNYRMRKAARLIVEQDLPLYMIMEQVGIRSQSHFVNTFKKEFGETPSSFMAKHRAKS